MNRRLSKDQVLDIFYSSDTLTSVAAKHGVTRQTASNIRRGERYRDITAPELLKRPTKLTCNNCRFYDGKAERTRHHGQRVVHFCNLGLPEIKQQGLNCANNCSYYLEDKS